MTFKEARAAMHDMANGRYYDLSYHHAQHSADAGGSTEQTCTVYLAGYGHHHGSTWDIAINKLLIAMHDKCEVFECEPE
jgi:hypothetical protein